MSKNTISKQDVVNLLNELLVLDPSGINNLFNYRVKTNTTIADHDTVQVSSKKVPGPKSEGEIEEFQLGFVGILNGLFGVDEKGMGAIYYSVKEETKDGEIEKIERFGILN